MAILDFTIAQNEKKRQVISDGSAKSPAVPLGAGLRGNFIVAAHP
jgi:hypothetical protein